MKKVAVILSGSGVYDGAEINEAVLTLLHLSKAGASYQCFAPNVEQHHVINHLTGEVSNESRNTLVEAARIARGEIKPLAELNAADFDALILPGGFGAAKNLCDFAVNGASAKLNNDVKVACSAFKDANKPAGYMCIAPVMVPMIYGKGVRVTVGNDAETAAAIEKLGGEHVDCAVDDIVVDENHRVVTTPAYMLAKSLDAAEKGISKLVERVLAMV
ncbi:isoprenoid biosynthesis glyoxalase ElbB [Pseudidiomarina marina]|uniref:Glyoxalase n=1 Tax=Pseudidiomarina marina TaxID=502366 RepID=A0A432YCZ0_9GAMM|nr:isoprenoid biosynthesis glyoxalase ElbB [Pseudidiomarina marina]PHR65781.1 MAG: isoprenoid biosynthesis protein ElbB [Idiomarina sp.]RUO58875.1 isoprenoid biosynthesis protein ElbB [Pseudidiomarina marina]